MGFRLHWRPRLGPIKFNIGNRGWTSTSVKLGPFTWNSKTRRTSVDLPGPINYQSRGRSRRGRRRGPGTDTAPPRRGHRALWVTGIVTAALIYFHASALLIFGMCVVLGLLSAPLIFRAAARYAGTPETRHASEEQPLTEHERDRVIRQWSPPNLKNGDDR